MLRLLITCFIITTASAQGYSQHEFFSALANNDRGIVRPAAQWYGKNPTGWAGLPQHIAGLLETRTTNIRYDLIDVLCAACRNDALSDSERVQALELLGNRITNDASSLNRRRAVYLIGYRCGHISLLQQRSFALLRAALTNPDEHIRSGACIGLGHYSHSRIPPAARRQAMDMLGQALADSDPRVLRSAISAVDNYHTHPNTKALMQAIVPHLNHADSLVRCASAQAIITVRPRHTDALRAWSALITLLSDESQVARSNAGLGLKRHWDAMRTTRFAWLLRMAATPNLRLVATRDPYHRARSHARLAIEAITGEKMADIEVIREDVTKDDPIAF
ncbi:MAG: HEAT repeat domain-containing protein [Planctomycetota bacterium]|jgi:HEAT repeat protein